MLFLYTIQLYVSRNIFVSGVTFKFTGLTFDAFVLNCEATKAGISPSTVQKHPLARRSPQMKSATRHLLQISGLALWLIFGLIVTAEAQNREKYIISAHAGGINYVSGNVTVQHLGEQRQRTLTLNDNLRTGDSVTTGAGGRVEVLLNPGSYMRVDENSEFELTDASLDNLLVKLVRGSAVVEVTGASEGELALAINTPQAETLIVKGGLYRFNVLPNETTEIRVRKGRALYGKAAPTKIKGGQKVLIRRGDAEVAKLDKKEQDALDLWSKERTETLARANARLERHSLFTAFDDYLWGDMSGWGQNGPRTGLWVYNSRTSSYCFLRLGHTGWSSPYGYNYGTGINGSNIPGNNRPRGQGEQPSGSGNPSNGNPSTGSGSTGGNGNGNPSPAQPSMPAPPAPQPQPQPSFQPPPTRTYDAPSERPPSREAPSNPNR
jgi:hypothetical protein